MKKKFIIFAFLFSLLSGAFANTDYLIGGFSLEGAFVPGYKFAEKCIPIRPTLSLSYMQFPYGRNLGFHVNCKFLPFSPDEDDDTTTKDDLWGLSLSVLMGPVFRAGDCFFFSPGVSAGFALFLSGNSGYTDSYAGVGINTFLILGSSFVLGVTGDYYPYYHYSTSYSNRKKGKKDVSEFNQLVRFGLYFAFVF